LIPEQYWVLLRRWYWLIGGVALGCALLALVVVPAIRGDASPGHSSTVTLGVTRLISSGGSISTVGGAGAPDLLTSYTKSIAARGSTPQFITGVRDRLAQQGLAIDEPTLARKLTVSADPGVFRIAISVTAGSSGDAELITQTAAQEMIDDVTAEETRVTQELSTNIATQKLTLTDDLNQIYASRTRELASIGQPSVTQALNQLIAQGSGPDLGATFNTLVADLARINSDPQLAVLNAQALSLEKQLGDLATTEKSFSAGSLIGSPVSIIDPVSTVELAPAPGLRTRDMLLMGGIAGLVIGWLLANVLDGQVKRNRQKVTRGANLRSAKVGGRHG
jgi:hypothetical protein